VFPGTPILAFNLTPVTSGVITCFADILVAPGGVDTLEFDAQVVPGGTATGGVFLGPSLFGGNDLNPLTIAPGTVVGRFQEPGVISTVQQRSMTLAFQVSNLTVGVPCCIVVYASSSSGLNAWSVSVNAGAFEVIP
jgi:hypothetical protein